MDLKPFMRLALYAASHGRNITCQDRQPPDGKTNDPSKIIYMYKEKLTDKLLGIALILESW